MNIFNEIQHPPRWLIIFIIVINTIGLTINIVLLPEKGWAVLFAILLVGFLFTLYYFFGRLKTEVNNEVVHLQFGRSFVKKYIFVKHVKSCKVVKNPWIYGWGIRWISFGHWMWNVKGLMAVELTFKDSKKKFRIGSQKPEALNQIIQGLIEP